MKIIYCLAGTFNSGGMERIVIDKANWLVDHGYDVSIITTEQNGRKDFFTVNKSIKRIDLDVMYSENTTSNPIKKFCCRRSKMKLHKRLMADVIESEHPDIIVSTFGNEVSFIPSFKDNSKKIAEIHFSRWYRLQLNRKGIWRLIDKYLTNQDYKILSRYDKFVCLTNEDYQNWQGLNNIEIIPNFIGIKDREKSVLTDNRIIAVGRLSYQKGYDRMIDSWKIIKKRFPDWKLDIFGGGELFDSLSEQILQNELNDSVFIHTPTTNIKDEYLKSSALLLTSHYEGLPMVLLEAMSYGLPIISFDCQCGPRDLIEDGVNGFLVKDGDNEKLADRISRLIESLELRQKQGDAAIRMASKYSKENVMEKWSNLFKSISK